MEFRSRKEIVKAYDEAISEGLTQKRSRASEQRVIELRLRILTNAEDPMLDEFVKYGTFLIYDNKSQYVIYAPESSCWIEIAGVKSFLKFTQNTARDARTEYRRKGIPGAYRQIRNSIRHKDFMFLEEGD